MELLTMLVVTGFGVGVAVDDLDRPLGVLELHLLIAVVVALMGNVLNAFPLAGRHAIVVRLLLLLLTELLCELLGLPTLLSAVAPGVVHRALWPTLVAAGGLAWPLVAAWATTPTSCDNNNSGSACQRLVVVVELLLPILVLAIALSSDICFGLAGLPYLWSRLGVSCTPICSPGAFVR
jgi:hypothetical protein